MIAVDHDFPFESSRQFQTVKKHIAWVAIARISVSFTNLLVAVPRVVVAGIRYPLASEFDPVDVDVTRVLISVARIIPTRVIHRASPRSHETGTHAGQTCSLGRDGRERRVCRDVTLDLGSQRPCVV